MPDVQDIRESQRALMQKRRASQRDLKIPAPENAERRRVALSDPFKFIETYFSETFDEPWTDQRREMVLSIHDALTTRTAQSIAAPRGQGKSTIAKCVLAYCVCRGLIRYAVLLAATTEHAQRLLENFKAHFERNLLLLADFPEICMPIRDVSTSPNKAGSQTADGEYTLVKWSADEVVFPTVADSAASGVVVAAKGITAAIRGLNRYDVRPDLVVIDDPDDEESAESESQTAKRVRKINASISGLAKMTRGIGRVMLCTIINNRCVAAQYTDRTINPAWNGKRFALVASFPEREDLWDTYCDLRREDQTNGDKFSRRAHAFYLVNREEMDRGAVVTNPYAFDPSRLGDGTQIEESAIQKCYNIIADGGPNGWEVFLTEYQNDPPSEAGDEADKLTPFKVRGSHEDYKGRVTGDARGFVPDGCVALTASVDVHTEKSRLIYYEIVAWYPGLRRHIVDYGNFGDPTIKDKFGAEESIKANLRDLKAKWDANPCCGNDGAVPFNKILVDSGYEAPIVYQIVREFGHPWQCSKGDGTYSHPKPGAKDKFLRPTPDPLHESQVGQQKVVIFDATWWGKRCHDSFTIHPLAKQEDGSFERPEGCVTIFGKDPKEHAVFGEQICAMEWQMTAKDGKTEKWEWVPVRRENHLFDTHVGNLVAGSYLGFSVTRKKDRPRITLSQLQADRRG